MDDVTNDITLIMNPPLLCKSSLQSPT